MCGFFGFLPNKDIEINDYSLMKEATNIIHHRGPDDNGFFENENVFFGFRRLSIIDIEGGHQPLSYLDNRYWIIFNGEIYNYLELREDLVRKGHEFNTSSDTEVIIAAYHEFKEDVVNHLRGMYSFLIWDSLEEVLFGARDHFGIKPLYYAHTSLGTFFGSEKKSIDYVLKDIQSLEINKVALHHYMTYQYPPEPYTMHEGVNKLLPGHYFKLKRSGNMEVEQYFTPKFESKEIDFEDLKNQVLETLRKSVQIHMRSDVPVGSFLSGGIDSSIIVALAKEVNPNIKTFTVGFEREGFSEIDLAKETAEYIGVENIHKVITAQEFLEELPKIVWHLDEPVADPAAIPLYFVSKEAKKHVTVVLSGEGSDELFGGYNIYREPLDLQKFTSLPKPIQSGLKRIGKIIPEGVKGKSYLERASQTIEERYVGNAKIFLEVEKQSLLKNYDDTLTYDIYTKPFYDEVENYDDPTKMQYIDMHTWLRGDILVKADRMTMANSLELRVPFLDKEVFALASKIKTEYKLTESTTKYILRQAAKEIIPDGAMNRRKLGFPVPIRHWMADEWFNWINTLLEEEKENPFVNTNYVIGLLKEHKEGRIDHSRKIWTVVIFLLWYALHVRETSLEELQSKLMKEVNVTV
ncbi:asparagine synthase (glutamine-hydrolyzing) [Bacillus sinesaloumensis]|uniref:asparagine synthase (glutamine-hydrolyzing) n=1 Tax=Litchfieldia sinesaloumensis TaxID=1926280 RepID=UPI0009888E34|nr:asparagine synthase (glutamine-hydrolyzing) [Bacillus sinesaloumensis]